MHSDIGNYNLRIKNEDNDMFFWQEIVVCRETSAFESPMQSRCCRLLLAEPKVNEA